MKIGPVQIAETKRYQICIFNTGLWAYSINIDSIDKIVLLYAIENFVSFLIVNNWVLKDPASDLRDWKQKNAWNWNSHVTLVASINNKKYLY